MEEIQTAVVVMVVVVVVHVNSLRRQFRSTPAVAAGQGLTGGWIGEEWGLRVEIVVFPIRAEVPALTAAALALLVGEAEVGTKTTTLL